MTTIHEDDINRELDRNNRPTLYIRVDWEKAEARENGDRARLIDLGRKARGE